MTADDWPGRLAERVNAAVARRAQAAAMQVVSAGLARR